MNCAPEPRFRPVILAVDDDQKDLELVERELRKRYEVDYHLVCEGSADAGRERLQRLKASGQDVAMVLAGLRKSGVSGVGFLVRVRDAFPLAKRLLLLDPMDGKPGPCFRGRWRSGGSTTSSSSQGCPPTSGSTG